MKSLPSGKARWAVPIALMMVLAVGAAGGIAYAAIPDSAGVIHGCYQKANGSLRVIDTQAGGKCSSVENPLDWNQTGPAGPRGPSDAYLASDGGKPISLTGTTLVSLTLPAGNYTLIAKTGVYSLTNPDIVDCLLQAGTTTLDEDRVRVDGLSTTNDDNEFMDLIGIVSLASTGTVSVVCTSSSSASENTQLLASQVTTLHQS
jgi:hypothetical protein